jgi:hypothetical protein
VGHLEKEVYIIYIDLTLAIDKRGRMTESREVATMASGLVRALSVMRWA